jgi:hypothetical protein
MTQPTRPVPTRELTAELVAQIGDLIAIEARLLRAEMKDTSARLLSSAGCLAGGACVTLAALVILLAAGAALLVRLGLAPDVACLIAAIVALAIGAGLVMWGIHSLKAQSLLPERSWRQVSSLGQLFKGR